MRLIPVVLLVACSQGPDLGGGTPADPLDEVDPVAPPETPGALIEPFQLPVAASGLTRTGETVWFLAPSVGLIETTAAGAEVSRIPWGTAGLDDYGFTDLARLDDGSFALTANQEAYRYRPAAAVVDGYFCFVPEEEPIVQENQAIAYDRATGLLHVSPVRWDTSSGTSQLLTIRLETYAAADATWQGAQDITSAGVIAHGLAWDAEERCYWSVAGSSLHRFSVGGVLEATVALEGVLDAQGIVIDGPHLAVLDGATGAVHIVPRP